LFSNFFFFAQKTVVFVFWLLFIFFSFVIRPNECHGGCGVEVLVTDLAFNGHTGLFLLLACWLGKWFSGDGLVSRKQFGK
jgi:hypothetical protein